MLGQEGKAGQSSPGEEAIQTCPVMSLQWTETHADGLFHSELSKMNGNAYVQQLVKQLVGLKERSQRHSDGLFTSEYSKMRGNAQVQKFIQNLMGRKRSSHSDSDAREAASITSQYVCPITKQLVADVKEDTDSFN
ncbi:hypothetical protein Q9966_013405 [Columba livia]|nr:hypothetical protein Q9966_013405 [Columba livia]